MVKTLKTLGHLKIDRARGPAPHKPLLLLCLLEMAECGGIKDEVMPVTGELAFRFFSYWSVVAHRRTQRPDVKLPLFHMRSDGIWQPLDREGHVLKHRELPAFLKFTPEFLHLLNDPDMRAHARAILIRSYFEVPEQVALWALNGKEMPEELENQIADDEAVKRGREGRFRIDVVSAYDYTCALTRYRLVTLSSGTIVDAAHIHQFSSSRNNALDNGIALSKNAHWLFDMGLWSLEDDYTVVVAEKHFSEAGDDAHLLGKMKGKKILLPPNPSQWPDKRHIRWHREHRFLNG